MWDEDRALTYFSGDDSDSGIAGCTESGPSPKILFFAGEDLRLDGSWSQGARIDVYLVRVVHTWQLPGFCDKAKWQFGMKAFTTQKDKDKLRAEQFHFWGRSCIPKRFEMFQVCTNKTEVPGFSEGTGWDCLFDKYLARRMFLVLGSVVFRENDNRWRQLCCAHKRSPVDNYRSIANCWVCLATSKVHFWVACAIK